MESKLRLKQKIRRNALVVDDEEINRMILGNILENDYEITYAADGREALDILNDKKKRYINSAPRYPYAACERI